ncbi:hypothetical protein R1sor_009946 [Riccia sorocarpa]|uniref:Uncharacterized protein n=1 Tax=Riccia sorocarpa TaxID=122646 RepID=A0ABD3I0J2_9MARC
MAARQSANAGGRDPRSTPPTTKSSSWRELFGDSPGDSTDRERLRIRSNQMFEETSQQGNSPAASTEATTRWRSLNGQPSYDPDHPQHEIRQEQHGDPSSSQQGHPESSPSKRVSWSDIEEDDKSMGDQDNPGEQNEEVTYPAWKRSVMDEVTQAFRQLPNRTGVPKEDEVEWLYQEVENKAAAQVQHVKILAPRHYHALVGRQRCDTR